MYIHVNWFSLDSHLHLLNYLWTHIPYYVHTMVNYLYIFFYYRILLRPIQIKNKYLFIKAKANISKAELYFEDRNSVSEFGWSILGLCTLQTWSSCEVTSTQYAEI